VRKLHLNAAGTVDTIAAPSKRLVVYGDSISVGFSVTAPQSEAYVNLLRGTYTGRVTAYGRGNLQFKTECETEPMRAVVAARIAGMLDGTVTNQVWIALGYNDNGVWTPSELQIAYADLLDKIHALKPTAVIFAQSPLTATVDTGLPAIRTAISNACTGRAWATHVDGTTIAAALGGDGIHPTTAGNVTIAAAITARV
jgi:lysophospholipase L1-like esterase